MHLYYIYQPLWIQQLGLFATNQKQLQLLALFIEKIPAKFSLVDIYLNEVNNTAKQKKGIQIHQRNNYILPLKNTYKQLHQQFNSNTKRNIKKAIKANLQIKEKINCSEVLQLYLTEVGSKIDHLEQQDYVCLLKVMNTAIKKNKGFTIGVYAPAANNSEKNTLCAAAFFLKSNGRLINLVIANNPNSKKNGANFFLLQHLLQKHEQSVYTLDFEGSMIAGIARFYSGFGAKLVHYPHLKINTLPWYIKWYKK